MELFDLVGVGGAHSSSWNVIVGFIKPVSAIRFHDRCSPAGKTSLIIIPRLSIPTSLRVQHIFIIKKAKENREGSSDNKIFYVSRFMYAIFSMWTSMHKISNIILLSHDLMCTFKYVKFIKSDIKMVILAYIKFYPI